MGQRWTRLVAAGPAVSVPCSTIPRRNAAPRAEDFASLDPQLQQRRPGRTRVAPRPNAASDAQDRIQETCQKTHGHTGSAALILHILASDTDHSRVVRSLLTPHLRQQLLVAFGSQLQPADAASRQSSSVGSEPITTAKQNMVSDGRLCVPIASDCAACMQARRASRVRADAHRVLDIA